MQNVVDDFVSKWNRNRKMEVVSAEDVLALESLLDVTLPESYVYLVCKFGKLFTPEILSSIVDNEIDFPDLQNVVLPHEGFEMAQSYERAGMPVGYMAFGNDCMGNIFCFNLDDCTDSSKTIPIWFFDHDFSRMKVVSNSFDEFLSRFNGIR